MGAKLMALPEEPFIRFAGLLSDSERIQALEAATVVVCPSPYESLSLLALEAMAVGHAGPRQRAKRGARRTLRQEQRRAVLRGPRRVRRMPEAAASATRGCAQRSAGTAATTCAETTGGTWCSAGTSGCSPRSGTPDRDDRSVVDRRLPIWAVDQPIRRRVAPTSATMLDSRPDGLARCSFSAR